MVLYPVEKALLVVILLLALVDAILIGWTGVSVDVAGYGAMVSVGFGLLLGGQFYRIARPSEGIGLAATAAGILVLFSNVGAAFNYLLLPRPAAPIDHLLTQVDASLGFSWPALMSWASESPLMVDMLRIVYMSYFPQLILVVLFLGFVCNRERLNVFLTAGVLSALLAVFSWAVFPSSGASAYWTLPEQVSSSVRPVVGVEYGKELYRLLELGVSQISPRNSLGLIGFPSYHTVGAVLCVYAFFSYPVLRLLALVVAVLMIPAILVHGGHHLMDVIGGLALGAFAIAAAKLIVRALDQQDGRLRFFAAGFPGHRVPALPTVEPVD